MGLGKGVTGTTQTGGGTLWVWKWEGGGRCRGEEGHVTVERVRTENGVDNSGTIHIQVFVVKCRLNKFMSWYIS
jgi:hypothetical protein